VSFGYINTMSPFDFSWMLGSHVKVSFSEPSTWCFTLGDSRSILVDCPWRLLHQGSIRISGEDHRQQFGLPAPLDAAEVATSFLARAVIRSVEVRNGTADLLIDFDDGWRLEIIPFSSGYESWQVCAPTGKTIIAQGGGQLCAW
jgi:Family of unknown function (DUF6188)